MFICGNIENRISRVVSEHRVPIENAKEHVLERDKKRSQHYHHYTDQTWGRAGNYNLCLDSSYLGLDLCVNLIVDNALI